MAAKLKKGDRVVVLAGRDKGKEGEILRVLPKENRALVSGINMVVRHRRQDQRSQGGRIPMEAAIDLSNLAFVDPKEGGPTRVGFRFEDGRKVRFAKKSGETIDG
jgi:large subunit ribosomal protein L24